MVATSHDVATRLMFYARPDPFPLATAAIPLPKNCGITVPRASHIATLVSENQHSFIYAASGLFGRAKALREKPA